MGSVHRRSRQRRFLTPLEWPSTPEVDGYTWELGPGPATADARWAAGHLNGDDHHFDGQTPEEVLAELAAELREARDAHEAGEADEEAIERAAEESRFLDLHERGIPPI